MYGGPFSPLWFNYSMAHMLFYSQTQMSSVKPPQSTGGGRGFGGGSFGGGGFSGGGFGGGGGGAW
jgi:uncharacterized membrane protein YgcG